LRAGFFMVLMDLFDPGKKLILRQVPLSEIALLTKNLIPRRASGCPQSPEQSGTVLVSLPLQLAAAIHMVQLQVILGAAISTTTITIPFQQEQA